MTIAISKLHSSFIDSLVTKLGLHKVTARNEANQIIKHYLGKDNETILNNNSEISNKQEDDLNELLAFRVSGQPLAHVIGSVGFLDFTIKCNKNALIPRPETEILCNCAIELIQDKDLNSVVDLGTGTGVIAASIARSNPNLIVDAYEFSKDAFELAIINKQDLGLSNINLINNSWTELDKQYDLVISNPPYVSSAYCEYLQTLNLLHDPLEALDGGKSGLECIFSIIQLASSQLNKGGYLLLEHGLGQQVNIINYLSKFKNLHFVHSVRDIQNIKRIICIRKDKDDDA